MKKFIPIIALCLSSILSYGQYTMNTTMEPYQSLVNPISLNNGAIWNEGSTYPIYHNFNFNIQSQSYTAVNVMAGGGLNFPGVGTKELYVYHSPFGGYFLKDRGDTTSTSAIGYEITGIPGQRILKVEWANAGFVPRYPTSSPTDYVNFQIWLFENDGHIEVHFGNHQTSADTYGGPNRGPSVKFQFDDCNNVLCVSGPSDLPSYGIYDLCSPNYYFINGTPSNGVVYNFYPRVIAANRLEVTAPEVSIFPNPFHTTTTLVFSEEQTQTEITVLDLLGWTLQTTLFSGLTYRLERNDWSSGVYWVRIKDQAGRITMKQVVVD